MRKFIFSKQGKKYFEKLSSTDQHSCIEKLRFLKESESFFLNFRRVLNLSPATHRLRVGNIRMLTRNRDEDTIEILKVGYRGDIYK